VGGRKAVRHLRFLLTALTCSALLSAGQAAFADDIDIFVGLSGGASAAPNVMFLIDNSTNWARQSQHWPNGEQQGQAELQAIASALPGISRPANVGLAMMTVAGPNGGYIRFAARDISNTTNVTALQNVLNGINPNATLEKVDQKQKDESAALYELYKYFYGLKPYAGAPSGNPEADFVGNTMPLTGAGQGLTSGFAFRPDGTYNSPLTGCSKSYIIYIVNNSNQPGVPGQSSYEPGVNVAPALPPTPVDMWTDEWTAYLYSQGIVTYIIDVYDSQDNVGYSQALMSAAKQGGGQYFQAGSGPQIQQAIATILDQIQAVSSSFAAANLPVSANSRTTDLNQVYIGMFQPDPDAKPRWFGNLKQYQLITQNNGSDVVLGDYTSSTPSTATPATTTPTTLTGPIPAVNPLTGFITQCAMSAWNQDTSKYQPSGISTAVPYWKPVPISPSIASTCPNLTPGVDQLSDAPDGPWVPKGGVAEVLRMGNNPPTTSTSPTWSVNRNVWTWSSGASTTIAQALGTANASLANFIAGQDVNDENGNQVTTETRPSIHGDVIHSQPLAVNYGGSTGIVVYYGANDGMLHAVSGGSGQELWGFVAPEFLGRLNRLMTDSPKIYYWNTPPGVTATPKDYFFDGSIGLYQDATSSKVWIYPAMRRGGRMLYALDVSNPSSHKVMWNLGCNTNDTTSTTATCAPAGTDTANVSGIGQTWSTPRVAFVKGYPGSGNPSRPVVIVGGGYDMCEDANTALPSCTSPKGAMVYVLDAETGAVLAKLLTDRSVVGDVSLVDVNYDGYVDYAYVADTGGNLYRISFVDSPTTMNPLGNSQWTITKIAYTAGGGRKFLYGPAVMPNSGQVYLAIGSGDREHPLYAQYPSTPPNPQPTPAFTTPVVNRFYLYLDDPSSTSSATNLDTNSAMADCTVASNCSSVSVVPGGAYKGWFMSLTANGTGEQVVSGALIAGGLVAFGTNQPVPTSAGSCATVLGVARGYWVNLLNSAGGITGQARSSQFVSGGFPNTPQMATVLIGNAYYTVVSGAAELNGGASSPIDFQRLTPPTSSKRKRVYWYTPIDN
jgi:type IV pilus assembly protein PilY1